MAKKERKNRKSEITEIILKLLAAGIIISAIFIAPGSAHLLKAFLRNKKIDKNYLRFREALKRAKEKRLIKVVEKNGKMFLEITEDGKKELVRYNFDALEIVKPKSWDGLWRVEIFDIPEKYKDGRDALSQKLKEMGFYRLQKSVFVYPFECENEVDFIKEFFDVSKYAILFRVKTFGDYYDLILKKFFNL